MGMVEVTPGEFAVFVQRILAERAQSLHLHKSMTLDGTLPILVTLADRGLIGVAGRSPEENAYLEQVRARKLPMLTPSGWPYRAQ